jgi:two-component sensor histidine kinase
MLEWLQNLRAAAELLPPGACSIADPRPLWLRAGTQIVAVGAILSIAAAGAVLLWRRRDLARGVSVLGLGFIAFLVLGAAAHLAAAAALFTPACAAQAGVQALEEVLAAGIGILVWPMLPRLTAFPSPVDRAGGGGGLAAASAAGEDDAVRRAEALARANARFELALSQSNITVFSQDTALRYTWIHNPRPGLTPSDLSAAEQFAGSPDAEAMKRSVLATGEAETDVVAVSLPDGTALHFQMTVNPTRDATGAIDGILCTAIDITERRLFDVRLAAVTAQLAAAYRRFELALENSPITVFEQDAELRYTFLHNPPPGLAGPGLLGRTDLEIMPEASREKVVSAKRRVLERGIAETASVEIEIDGCPRFYDLRIEPRFGDDGVVEGVIGTAVDLTEQRRSDRQMRLVMRELTHRSKNLLAVVQAMARKTASMAPDMDTFIRDFSARLRAIAAAHDLLVAESWSGAELRDLLVASLSQTVNPKSPEIGIEGPPVKLPPDTAQTLGLAFHELTMNAARHGSLSVPGGRLAVLWTRRDETVALEWRESSGPRVTPPSRTGFGRLLLERLVAASLNGSVTADFRPEGLVVRIEFPAPAEGP